jgi:hypothetical protein
MLVADQVHLPRYTFYCRSFVDDEPKVIKLRGYPNLEPRGDEANPTKLIKQSLMRWGKDRKETEAKILKILSSS